MGGGDDWTGLDWTGLDWTGLDQGNFPHCKASKACSACLPPPRHPARGRVLGPGNIPPPPAVAPPPAAPPPKEFFFLPPGPMGDHFQSLDARVYLV